MINMKISKYEKIGKDKYRIYLENGEVIDTYDNVILNNDLLLRKEIDSGLYNKIISETSIEELYISCKKYIEYRIRSVKEVKNYLIKKNISDSNVDEVINKLIENKYLDDDYFCKCFIHDKLKFTNMGFYQIINELKRNDISDDIVESYSYLLSEDVMNDRINRLIDKGMKSSKDKSKLRNKLYNNLVRLGYPMDLVIRNLNNKF